MTVDQAQLRDPAADLAAAEREELDLIIIARVHEKEAPFLTAWHKKCEWCDADCWQGQATRNLAAKSKKPMVSICMECFFAATTPKEQRS